MSKRLLPFLILSVIMTAKATSFNFDASCSDDYVFRLTREWPNSVFGYMLWVDVG